MQEQPHHIVEIADVWNIAFSPDEKYLVVANTEGDIYLIHTNNWTIARSLKLSDRRITGLHFSQTGSYLLASGWGGTILLNFPDLKIIGQSDLGEIAAFPVNHEKFGKFHKWLSISHSSKRYDTVPAKLCRCRS